MVARPTRQTRKSSTTTGTATGGSAQLCSAPPIGPPQVNCYGSRVATRKSEFGLGAPAFGPPRQAGRLRPPARGAVYFTNRNGLQPPSTLSSPQTATAPSGRKGRGASRGNLSMDHYTHQSDAHGLALVLGQQPEPGPLGDRQAIVRVMTFADAHAITPRVSKTFK
jgi:hypothetical protein